MYNYEIKVRSILILLYFLVFGIFAFGPGIDGIWSTTGFRALYPFFFELIVLVSFTSFLIYFKSEQKVIVNSRLSLLTVATTLTLYLIYPDRFNKPLFGDEISYVNLARALLTFSLNRFNDEIRTSVFLPPFFVPILAICFCIILLYIFKIRTKLKDYTFVLILVFIILRQACNALIGFNYQYPLAFELPLLLPTLLDLPIEFVRIFWVNSILFTFATVIFNSPVLRTRSYRIYFVFMIVCLQPNVLDYLTQIEPIWFSVIAGTYITTHILSGSKTGLDFRLILMLSTFRLPGLFWVLMSVTFPTNLQHIRHRQMWKHMSLFLFLFPLFLHSGYRILLGFLTDDSNQVFFGLSRRVRELHDSMLSEFGFFYPFGFLLFISLLLFLRLPSQVFNVFAVIFTFFFFLPNGAISDNKYAIEIFVPIQISLLSTIISSSFVRRIFKK